VLKKPAISKLLQELSTFYGTRKVHYRVYKNTPVVPILRLINLVHLRLGLSSGLFSLDCSANNYMRLTSATFVLYALPI
jgi:hypothetical protein